MNPIKLCLSAAISAVVLGTAPATAGNLVYQFNNPNFGGNPNISTFLFGLAEAQRTATADIDGGGGGGAGAPAVGGTGGIGGPTIIIPIDTGTPTAPTVGTPTTSPAQAQQIAQ